MVKKTPYPPEAGAFADLSPPTAFTAEGEADPTLTPPEAFESETAPAYGWPFAFPGGLALAGQRPPPLPEEIPPDAISAALLVARRPAMLKAARSQPLPADLVWLFRIAAGSRDALRRGIDLSGKDPSFIRAAAIFYIDKVVWTDDIDHYRVLGLPQGASHARVAEHTRWLMRWLLPYLGEAKPDAERAERVLAAWRALGSVGPIVDEEVFPLPPTEDDEPAPPRHGPLALMGDRRQRQWIGAIAAVGAAIAVFAVLGRLAPHVDSVGTGGQAQQFESPGKARAVPDAN